MKDSTLRVRSKTHYASRLILDRWRYRYNRGKYATADAASAALDACYKEANEMLDEALSEAETRAARKMVKDAKAMLDETQFAASMRLGCDFSAGRIH